MLILWYKLVALISLPAQGRCTCLSQKPWRFEGGRSWRRRSGQCWARVPRASKNSFTKVRKHVCRTRMAFNGILDQVEPPSTSTACFISSCVSELQFKAPITKSSHIPESLCQLNKLQVTKGFTQRTLERLWVSPLSSVLCPVNVWLITQNSNSQADVVSPVHEAANQIS